MLNDMGECCSFMMPIGLHSKCTETAWAVLLTTARFFDKEDLIKDESGTVLWEAEGIATTSVEGASAAKLHTVLQQP